MLKVPYTDLEEPENLMDVSKLIYFYRGELFTGIAVEETESFYCEYGYENGLPHGLHFCTYKNGQKMSEEHYDHGKAVGEDLEWFPSGQLKSFVTHESPYQKRLYIENGTLIFEEIDHKIRKCFYASGELKSHMDGFETEYFDRSGELWMRVTRDTNWNYTKVYYEDALRRSYLELSAETDLRGSFFLWMKEFLESKRELAEQILSDLMDNGVTFAKSDAITFARVQRCLNCIPAIKRQLENSQIPGTEINLYDESSRSSNSEPINVSAQKALTEINLSWWNKLFGRMK